MHLFFFIFFLFCSGLFVAWMFIVQLHSYNGYVVENVMKWLCFYVCEGDRRGQKESIMDEHLSQPERERKRDGPVPLLASSMFAWIELQLRLVAIAIALNIDEDRGREAAAGGVFHCALCRSLLQSDAEQSKSNALFSVVILTGGERTGEFVCISVSSIARQPGTSQ